MDVEIKVAVVQALVAAVGAESTRTPSMRPLTRSRKTSSYLSLKSTAFSRSGVIDIDATMASNFFARSVGDVDVDVDVDVEALELAVCALLTEGRVGALQAYP